VVQNLQTELKEWNFIKRMPCRAKQNTKCNRRMTVRYFTTIYEDLNLTKVLLFTFTKIIWFL